MTYLTDPNKATWIWFALTVTNGFLAMLNLLMGTVWVVMFGALVTAVCWRMALRAGAQRDAQA
jgi:hypothetical protein